MLNISKYKALDEGAEFLSYTIKRDSTYISVDIDRGEDAGTLSFKIKKTDITEHPSFDEQTYWIISDEFLSVIPEDLIVPTKFIVPVLTKTYNTKDSSISNAGLSFVGAAVMLFFKTKNIDDVIFRTLVAKTGSTTEFFGNTNEEITYTSEETWKEFVGGITATTNQTTVAAGDPITVNVICEDNVSMVYLEPIVGILPKTRVKITNKTGSFIINTDGLVAGDEVSIKLGYKYFTGVTVFNKTLA
jgi:hypothetical protein